MPWRLRQGLWHMRHNRREQLRRVELLAEPPRNICGQAPHRRGGLREGQEALATVPEPPLSLRISFQCRDWDLTWRTWRRHAVRKQWAQAGIGDSNQFSSHLLMADFFCRARREL